jgi:outer membrane protein TolC
MAVRAALAALWFFCIPPLAAAGERLTLDDAIQQALTRNRTLSAARAGADEAAERETEARAAFFPRVSFTESWQHGDQPVFVFSSLLSARQFEASNFAIDALNHPDPLAFFHGVFSVEQLVFDGGRTRAAVGTAESRRDMADAGASELALAVVTRVTETYGRLLRAESGHRAAQAAVAAAQEDLARAERRRDAGVATDADVLSLAVHLGDVRQRAIQASGDAAIARAELNRLTGAPVTRDVSVEEPVPVTSVAGGADLAALLREAEAARPELRRAEAGVEAAEGAADQARAAWWPSVVAQAAYLVDGTSFSDRASAWVVGGELRWSWSTGGGQAASIRAASHAVTRARAERDDAVAAVHVDVVSALRALETAEASEAAARSGVEQARESDRIIRNRFDAGLAGVTDVLRSSTAALDAESRRVAALANLLQAGAALRRALGRDSAPVR